MSKIGLYAMTAKGVAVLKKLLSSLGAERIAFVVTAHDAGTAFDGVSEIQKLAGEAGVPFYLRQDAPKEKVGFLIAVSWRWLIPASEGSKLIVFHDSLLPKYRGFAPLVSALINGEKKVGVTALLASDEYDRGPIIAQESIRVFYPITIQQAIEDISVCYEKLAERVGSMVLQSAIESSQQDEASATYSLWRDDDDYLIDWNWDAEKIRRFVDAVGYPYKGALTFLGDRALRLLACEKMEDVVIENRDVGKVIFVRDQCPIVVCGRGLLKIQRLVDGDTGESVLPLKKFRSRFGCVN